MKYYLAIDIGASSGRHILGWLEGGKMHTQEIYRFANSPQNKDGKLKWDENRLFGEIVAGLKKVGELGKLPYSVGIDTWGVDYALLDEDDNVIDGVYCYRDSRTDISIPRVHEKIAFENLYERTGISFNSFNTVYQLYDDVTTGRINNAKTYLALPDYFHFKLTGVKKQEYTHATTTGMVNARTHQWDKEIISTLGFNDSLFGELCNPGTVIGEFTEEIQKAVGYKAKVILPASHDTASAVLAAPLDGQTPYISSGTWSLLGIEQDQAHTDYQAMQSVYSNEGSVDFKFRFQKNIMGLWMLQQVKRELNDEYSFSQLAEIASQCPIEDKIDVNSQKFLAPESMIEEINKTVGRTLTVGETVYCILNNLAHDYFDSLNAMEEMLGKKFDTLNIIGGGSKNQLLNQLTKQKTGKRIITGPTEGTAIGNLMMQMIGSGQLESVEQGRDIVKKSFDISEVI